MLTTKCCLQTTVMMRLIRYDFTTVNADPEFEDVIRTMTNFELLDAGQQVERHGRDLASVVVSVTTWQAADHHVGVAYRFDFVDVIILDDAVKECVEVIQHVHNLWNTAPVIPFCTHRSPCP